MSSTHRNVIRRHKDEAEKCAPSLVETVNKGMSSCLGGKQKPEVREELTDLLHIPSLYTEILSLHLLETTGCRHPFMYKIPTYRN